MTKRRKITKKQRAVLDETLDYEKRESAEIDKVKAECHQRGSLDLVESCHAEHTNLDNPCCPFCRNVMLMRATNQLLDAAWPR